MESSSHIHIQQDGNADGWVNCNFGRHRQIVIKEHTASKSAKGCSDDGMLIRYWIERVRRKYTAEIGKYLYWVCHHVLRRTAATQILNAGLRRQETRMLSQALNRAMLHSLNQLEEVNRKKFIFYLAVQLYCTLKQ